jgi:hypothetical protein
MAEPESVGVSSERLGRIRVAMQRYIDKKLVPGVVTLVARKGKVVHLDAVGSRYVEEGLPMTSDTIFRIASMTKAITSVALMTLFEKDFFFPIGQLTRIRRPLVAVSMPRKRSEWRTQSRSSCSRQTARLQSPTVDAQPDLVMARGKFRRQR